MTDPTLTSISFNTTRSSQQDTILFVVKKQGWGWLVAIATRKDTNYPIMQKEEMSTFIQPRVMLSISKTRD